MRNADSWFWKVSLMASIMLLQLAPTDVPAQSLSVLYHFGTNPGDPIWFRETGLLAEGPDGSLYGTSPQGGKFNNQGTVFRMTLDGKLTVLHNFDGKPTGGGPQGGLTCRKDALGKCDGTFYGTAYGGGNYSAGTIFRSTTAVGAPNVLYHFRGGHMLDVVRPSCSTPPCPYTTQQRLDGVAGFPVSPPVQGRDGNFYGVTPYTGNYKFGVLYRISPGGGPDAFKVLCIGGALPTNPLTTDKELIDACMFNGDKGNYPVSLIAASDGNLYGVAYGGLANDPYGTIFKASLDGRVTLLHKFDLANGASPYSLMQGKDGKLYGTTAGGGPTYGVIYRLPLGDPPSPPTVLKRFNGTDGMSPVSGMAQGLDGTLYGTAKYGGRNGRGVIYQISPAGTCFRVLHNFDLYGTGRTPVATPILHSNNRLYGTTYQGGSQDAGVFYSLDLGSSCPDPGQGNLPCNSTREYSEKTEGTKRYEDEKVRVDVGRTWKNAGGCSGPADLTDGITITVKNCKQNPRVVQFIHREQMLATGKLEPGTYEKSTGCTTPPVWPTLTTDFANPAWHPDGTPYYNSYRMDCDPTNPDSMTIFDAPNFKEENFDPAKYKYWRATFRSFVLCNGEVVREIRWTRTLEGAGKVKTYTVDTVNVMPDPDDVEKLQCVSKGDGYKPWAPCNAP